MTGAEGKADEPGAEAPLAPDASLAASLVASEPDAEPAPPPPPRRRRLLRRRQRTGLGLRLILFFLVAGLGLLVLALTERSLPLPVWAVAEVEDRLNRAMEDVLPEGALSVGAIEVTLQDGWGPELTLSDLRLIQPGGRALLVLPEAQLSFDGAAFLEGRLRIGALRLVGAQIALTRDRDGRIDLDFGRGPGPAIGTLPELFAAMDQVFDRPALQALRQIDAEALTLRLTDQRAGRVWDLGDGRLGFTVDAGRFAAELGLSLVGGGTAASRATLTAIADRTAGTARIAAEVQAVAASDLAAQTPVLAPLAVLDAPISGRIAAEWDGRGMTALDGRLDIGPGRLQPGQATAPIGFDSLGLGLAWQPSEGRILLTDLALKSPTLRIAASGQVYLAGPDGAVLTGPLGDRRPDSFLAQLAFREVQINPEGLFAAPVAFQDGALDARLRLDPFQLDVGQMVLRDGAQEVHLSGQAEEATGGWRLALDVAINEVTLPRLIGLWPLRLVERTRDWVGRNVRNAVLTDVRAALRLEPGQEPVMQLGYEFREAELKVMAQMPPITGAKGFAVIEGNTYSIVMSQGIVTPPEGGQIDVTGSVFQVPDIRQIPASGLLNLRTRSSLTAALSLMDQEPFRFLTKAGRPVTLGQGEAAFTGWARFPLQRTITFADVDFQTQGTVTGFASDQLVPGHVVTSDALQVAATPEGMQISGPGRLGQVPYDVTYAQTFTPGGPAPTIRGTVDLSQAGIDEFDIGLPASFWRGTARGTVEIDLPRDAAPQMRLTSDLTGATLAIPELGWSKSAGRAGRLALDMRLGDRSEVTALSLDAAGLQTLGRVSFTAAGGLEAARFDRVRLGGWLDAPVTIRGQGARAPVAFDVGGGTVDLRRLPTDRSSPGGAGGSAEGSPLDLRLDSLQVTDTIALTGFRGQFRLTSGVDGGFVASVNGDAPVRGAVAPTEGGTAVRLQSDDAGRTIRAAGMFASARGGALDLTLIPRKGSTTYDGRAEITNIRVVGANVLAELLNALSVIGLLEQLNGPGIAFANADAEFLLKPAGVELTGGAAVGASMGVSMAGVYRSADGGLDMSGVLSPIYLVNGIGALISRPGEGVFGFNYTLRGTSDAPIIGVNPLSILTPGMFRDIFRRPIPTLEGQ